MATAKTKPVTEEPDTEPATTEPSDDFTEKVTAVLKDVLPGMLGGAAATTETETESVEDTTTMTSRQEESRAYEGVREAIKDLKDAFTEGKDAAKADKKEPEAEPGKKPTPWIQRVVWGIE